jgi:PAS domain S-box-containing protein
MQLVVLRGFDIVQNVPEFTLFGVSVDDLKLSELGYKSRFKALARISLLANYQENGQLGVLREFFVKGLGYSYTDLDEKGLADLVFWDERVISDLWLRMRNGYNSLVTERFLTKQGLERWYSLHFAPILNVSGGLIEVLQIAWDVTHELRVKKELELVDKSVIQLGNEKKDLELELSLIQSKVAKLQREHDFDIEHQKLLVKQEVISFEKQREDFKQEIVSLHAKINELELERNLQRANYERYIDTLSRIFEEDRRKLNNSMLRLENELVLLRTQPNQSINRLNL